MVCINGNAILPTTKMRRDDALIARLRSISESAMVDMGPTVAAITRLTIDGRFHWPGHRLIDGRLQ
jgi:hypothetical protein